jgi:ribose 1,5-bisphosphate isomerase
VLGHVVEAHERAEFAASGAVVNKIGTSSLAVDANDRGVPVTVAAQTLKLHPEAASGDDVEIELRDQSEVVSTAENTELGDVGVANPAFDVTPPEFIDSIVTERGQFSPDEIAALNRKLFGDSPIAPWED